MIRYFLVFVLFFGVFSASAQFFNAQKSEKIYPIQGKKYKVIKVKDGDTVGILIDNAELSVRLNHIDTPEKKQPYGTKAKQFVSQACFGQYVTLVHSKKYDKYGRLIAEIILPNGKNLNKALVENGLAWHYIKHSSDMEYAKLEFSARKRKINIWSEKDPIAPWNWRKIRKEKK